MRSLRNGDGEKVITELYVTIDETCISRLGCCKLLKKG